MTEYPIREKSISHREAAPEPAEASRSLPLAGDRLSSPTVDLVTTAELDLDGISPIGKPTSAAATATQQQQQLTWQQAGPAPQPVTPGLPSAGLQTVSSRASLNISRAYDPAQAFGLSGRASAKNAPPLQAALLQRPSAITKLAPNTFLPSHVRGLIAAPGEAHFAHTSRFGGGMV